VIRLAPVTQLSFDSGQAGAVAGHVIADLGAELVATAFCRSVGLFREALLKGKTPEAIFLVMCDPSMNEV
jgi:hypothetical protein